jgi:hypothetical protein
MEWNFSFASLLIGLAITVVGGLLVILHQKISDFWLSGANSYNHVKLVGVITILVGLIIMTNLHTLILTWLVNIIFRRNG